MKRRLAGLIVLAAAVATSMSCLMDDSPPPSVAPPKFAKEDLSHKTDVLNNIEYAYNKRDFTTYDELLDVNFTFFYSESDVGGSGTPIQWGRPDEITTTSGLLNGADMIDMNILWEKGVTWSSQIAGSETWYVTTVYYNFKIQIGETTYIPNQGARAQFTVRNDGTEEKPKWKLVEFRDLGGPSLALAMAALTEPTTWGQVKALYR